MLFRSNPLLSGLAGVLVSGAIAGLVPTWNLPDAQVGEHVQMPGYKNAGILRGIADAFTRAAINAVEDLTDDPATFTRLATHNGYGQALEMILANSLQQSSLESLYTSVENLAEYAFDRYENGATDVLYNNSPAKEIVLNGESSNSIVLTFDAVSGELVRFQENGRVLEGDIRFDARGKLYVYDGSELISSPNGAVIHSVYANGGLKLHQDIREGVARDYYAEPNKSLFFFPNGTLSDGILHDLNTDSKTIVRDGKVVEVVQKLNFEVITSAGSSELKSFADVHRTVNAVGEVTDTQIQVNTEFNEVFRGQQGTDINIDQVESNFEDFANFNGTPAALADEIDRHLDSFGSRFNDLTGGTPTTSSASLAVTAGIGMLKGFSDILRLGTDTVTAAVEFSAAAANGEFQAALSNFWHNLTTQNVVSIFTPGNLLGENTPHLNAAFAAIGREGLRIVEIVGVTSAALQFAKYAAPLVGGLATVLRNHAGEVVFGQGGFIDVAIESVFNQIKKKLNSALQNDSNDLARWFGLSGNKKYYIDNASLDDLVLAIKKGAVQASDVPFRKGAELERLIAFAQNQNISTGKITTVLGHFTETQHYLGRPNLNLLNEAFDDSWTYSQIWDYNRRWLDDIIRRGDDILLVSDELKVFRPDGLPTYYSKELEHLVENGYVRIGNYMKKITD